MSNVIEFEAYRAADDAGREKIVQGLKPVPEPGLWPPSDYNEIGHHFRAFAAFIRKGPPKDPAGLADLMERYSAACFAIHDNVREIEQRMIRAEKALRHKTLRKAIKCPDKSR